jgi:glycosyltransferase involved in cell wall biosynthesis
MVWGEKIVVHSQAKVLRREFPGAEVLALGRDDLATIENRRIDLLLSYYTGPEPPWRVDDIADYVEGVTLLVVVNHADLLDEFARIPVDGFITNSARGAELLGRQRPSAYIPLAIDDDYAPAEPIDRYRADVVYLGSGGRGNKRAETTRHYLDPAKRFDFALWGSWWERDYWAPVYAENPEANDWHRFWRGPLPFDDIARLYSSAKIVLNYHEDSQREWGMWNNRVFEALGCGALLITDDAAGLREELGDGLVITPGGEATADLIAFHLDHAAERRRVGEIGREIVQRKYTHSHWAHAVRELYERIRRSS